MKKGLSVLLCIIIVWVVTSCTKQVEIPVESAPAATEAEIEVESSYEEPEELMNSAYTEIEEEQLGTKTDEEQENEKTIRIEKYSIDHILFSDTIDPFAEGSAWVVLKKEENFEESVALVDKNGKVLYIVDKERFPEDVNGKGAVATPFIKGTSAIYFCDGSASRSSLPGFVIVNSKGEELYFENDPNMYLCGRANDGNYIVGQFESGFAGEQWCIRILDSDIVYKDINIQAKKPSVGDVFYNFEWIHQSDSIYTIDDGIYLKDNHILNLWKEVEYWGIDIHVVWYDDENIVLSTTRNTYKCPKKDLREIETYDQLLEWRDSNPFCAWEPHNVDTRRCSPFMGGSWIAIGNGYKDAFVADFDGNELFRFPKFPEAVYYDAISGFSDGYSALYLIGGDGNDYVTIADTNGEMMYEPLQYNYDKYTGYRNNKQGFVFTQEEVIDRNGNYFDKKNMTDICEYARFLYNGGLIDKDQYVYYNYSFVNAEGNLLDEFTAEFDDFDNELIESAEQAE